MIEDHYNAVMTMNKKLTHVILESNVKRKTMLQHEVGKLQDLSRELIQSRKN